MTVLDFLQVLDITLQVYIFILPLVLCSDDVEEGSTADERS